jgi:hypothetical protein
MDGAARTRPSLGGGPSPGADGDVPPLLASGRGRLGDAPWFSLLLVVLAVGIAARVVSSLFADSFNIDEYYIMVDVKRSLGDYLAHYRLADGRHSLFALPLLVHYWLSARVLGTSLVAFRVASLSASVALLPLTAMALRRLWPKDRIMALTVLGALTLHSYLLWLSRYAMVDYANSLLVSTGLFFLFVRLTDGPISRRAWLWTTLILIPATFFTQATLVVPVVIGAVLMLAFRWAQMPPPRRLAGLCSRALELLPLLVIPAVYTAVWLVAPYDLAHARRADTAPYFFGTSGFQSDAGGALRFLGQRTADLWSQLVNGAWVRGPWLAMATAVLALTGAAVAFRRSGDRRLRFTALFVIVCFVVIAVLGLVDAYPYGSVRYATFLIVPMLVTVGCGASRLVSLALMPLRRVIRPRTASAAALVCAAVIALAGSLSVERSHRSYSWTKNANRQALAQARSTYADLVLVDPWMDPEVRALVPDLYERRTSMGPSGVSDVSRLPAAATARLAPGSSVGARTVVVVLRANDLTDLFPAWKALLDAGYSLAGESVAPSVWVGEYRRTRSLSP